MQQTVARACFANGLAQIHNSAVGQNNGHCKNVVARNAVLDGAHAACVCRNIAADRRGLFAGIRRIHKAARQRVGCQIAQQNARLNMHDEVIHVVGKNFVHASCAKHNSAAQRHAAADKSRTCAARSYGDVVFIAKAHYLRDFLGALDLADDLRIVFAVNRHFVVAEIVLHRILGEKAFRADDGLKFLSNLRRNFVVLRHFRPPH